MRFDILHPSMARWYCKIINCACVASFTGVMSEPVLAQEVSSLQASYTITSEAAVGSGHYTAYQLTANRHDVLSHRSNTAYMRAALGLSKALDHDLELSGSVDFVASIHAKQSCYLQQCYAELSWHNFYVEAGAREHHHVLRDERLSSGSMTESGNARPIPGLQLGTHGFITVPGTRGWLQTCFEGGYGYFMDGAWLRDRFDAYQLDKKFSYVTSNNWYHGKKLFLRTDPTKRLSFAVGMEHAVVFAGDKRSYESAELKEKHVSPTLKSFFQVLIPRSDGNSTLESGDGFVFGNHVGNWNLQADWRLDAEHQLSIYLESPFEDGSGIRKGNQWDGLWGLEYHDASAGLHWVKGVVLEYLRTLDQSGPIHWAPADFVQPEGVKFPSQATGNDNYYNNYYYNGFAHYGQALGNGLLKSPIYNRDGYLNFTDNRVQAWHLAVEGDVSAHFDYMLKGSYREGRGTYFVPLSHRSHSLDLMAQCRHHLGSWSLAAALGITHGNVYGNCATCDIKITYHGKIL